jgi:Flp pilus assembly protein TadG
MATSRSLLSRFGKDTSGGLAVLAALMLPLACATGLASMDYTIWSRTQGRLQQAVDAAAIAVLKESRLIAMDANQLNDSATRMVQSQSGIDTGTLTVTAAYDGGGTTLRVTASQIVPTVSGKLLGIPFDRATATSSARAVGGTTKVCIVALSGGGINQNLLVKDSGIIQANGCSVFSNSTHTNSIFVNNNRRASLTAAKVFSAGGAGGAQSTPPAITSAPAIDDPFGTKPQPATPVLPSNCTGKATMLIMANESLSAGNYCGTVSISNAANVTFLNGTYYFHDSVTITDYSTVRFNPGTYVFRRGLTISDGANVTFGAGTYTILGAMTIHDSTVTGEDVGFYFYGPDAANNGSNSGLRITGNATVNLSAPLSGTMAGMLVWYNRNSFNNAGNVWQISSTNVRKMTGAIYIPRDKINFIPSAPIADQSPWTAIVAGSITVGGSAALTLNSNYNSPGAPPAPPEIAANTYGNAGSNIAIVK